MSRGLVVTLVCVVTHLFHGTEVPHLQTHKCCFSHSYGVVPLQNHFMELIIGHTWLVLDIWVLDPAPGGFPTTPI